MTDTKKPAHILVVDDDQDIRTLLAKVIGQYGYMVSTAVDGKAMNDVLRKSESPVDLIILDIMMPGDDGIVLCKKLREKSHIPVIMLSAMGDEHDRIVGLEVGADDYLPKPFNPRELIARIKAVLRRPRLERPKSFNALRFGRHVLLIHKRSLLHEHDAEMPLSTGEFDLLMIFLQQPQQVLSRDHLSAQIKNRRAEPFDRSIDMQVSRLRQKIEGDPKTPKYIKTVRSGGYLFVSDVEKIVWP